MHMIRDAGLTELYTLEPHPLGPCLFRGVRQITRDALAEPRLNRTFDLVMSVEVAEHVPRSLHPRLIEWIIGHSRR